MKVSGAQLAAHLERGLSGIYLIAADEPLLVSEAADAIRLAATKAGFTERSLHFVERGFRWESLKNDADSLSLFASRRIIEIRMSRPKPGDAGGKAIRELAEDEDPDRVVIVSIQSRLDRSAASAVWVKTLDRLGVLVEIGPVARSRMPQWVTARAKQRGLSIDPQAAELLADRVEGNLLAADQELAKLALIIDNGHIDQEAVLAAVATSARFDVFRLSDAVIAGDLARALTVLDALKSEGVQPPLVLWALVREISLLSGLKSGVSRGRRLGDVMTGLGVWQSRRPALERALERFSNRDLTRLMRRAAAVDRTIKGGPGAPAWAAILGLLLEMLAPTGRRLPA